MRLYQVTMPKSWTVEVRAHSARQARKLALSAKAGATVTNMVAPGRTRCIQLAESLPNDGRQGIAFPDRVGAREVRV